MCKLCDENGGECLSCQDCGRLICYDFEPDNIDVLDRAYVTASGDLYCARCGREYDMAEEEEFADDFMDDEYPYSWYDPDMDFENEDSNGVYIGDDE